MSRYLCKLAKGALVPLQVKPVKDGEDNLFHALDVHETHHRPGAPPDLHEAAFKHKYKRTIADLLLPDGTDANHELVKEGWCWWYWKYAPSDTVFEGLEKEAREAKKGLWVDPQPVPPWKWRKRRD